jgi:hypothetical protein
MRMTTQLIHFTQWARILTIVDDSSWEPDGVTLQVRFGSARASSCEACRYFPNHALSSLAISASIVLFLLYYKP